MLEWTLSFLLQNLSTASDSLGLLITITLGGLSLFLMVLAFSFMVTQILMKNKEGFTDEEDYLVECEGHDEEDPTEVPEEVKSDKDIFIIETSDDYRMKRH